jgi:hypothetical protein
LPVTSAIPSTVFSARDVEVLEHDPAMAEFAHSRFEVVDLPRHLGVIARGHAGGLEEGEFTASAAVAKSARAFLDRLQPELSA